MSDRCPECGAGIREDRNLPNYRKFLCGTEAYKRLREPKWQVTYVARECLERQLSDANARNVTLEAENGQLQAAISTPEIYVGLVTKAVEADRDAVMVKNRKLQAIVDKLRNGPTKVCLCGSTRFMEAFFAAGWELTLLDQIVLSIGVCKHAPDHGAEALGEDVVVRLDDLHKRKIDLADWVLVLNVEGYIGESTGSEIEYARSQGKPVQFLFSSELIPPRKTPPEPENYQSWDTIAAAIREAAKKKT